MKKRLPVHFNLSCATWSVLGRPTINVWAYRVCNLLHTATAMCWVARRLAALYARQFVRQEYLLHTLSRAWYRDGCMVLRMIEICYRAIYDLTEQANIEHNRYSLGIVVGSRGVAQRVK